MITRIVMLMLIAVLALPIGMLPQPVQTSPSPWGDVSVEAKGKKRKKPTRRKTVSRTFASTESVTIPHDAPGGNKGPASPYPSTIVVGGFRRSAITDVNVILTDLTHGHYDDLDILLNAPDGRRALVMSDVGDLPDVAGEDLDLVLDDEAAASMPGENEHLRTGRFRPTNLVVSEDIFDAPAPAPDGAGALSTFDGTNPNGTWQLWVMDNAPGEYGDIGGWSLQITAEVDVNGKSRKKKHK